MIDFAITFLIAAIVIASLFQPTAPRLFAAIVLVMVTYSHELFFTGLIGFKYYATAALFDLAIITITSGINPAPKMVLALQKICIVSAIANLIGWVLWYFYVSSIYYNMAYIIIYGWIFFTLIERNKTDVGGYTMAGVRSCFRFNHHPIYRYLSQNKGQV